MKIKQPKKEFTPDSTLLEGTNRLRFLAGLPLIEAKDDCCSKCNCDPCECKEEEEEVKTCKCGCDPKECKCKPDCKCGCNKKED